MIAAALSVQDPRERPTEQRQAADARHARFAGEFTADGRTLDAAGSDFLAFLNLWNYLAEQRADAVRQPVPPAAARGVPALPAHPRVAGPARPAARGRPHAPACDRRRAPTPTRTGSTSRCSPGCSARSACWRATPGTGRRGPRRQRGGREYLGARGAKFMIFPGSPLARKPPRWVMAAELVETSRLFARTVARINPEWIEPLAGHLVRRTYSEPHWSRKRAAAVATERVTLHGIPIVAGRTVDFGRIDPELSRELFIRHALVEGDWDTRHRFFHANRELLDDVEELEHRARRRDLVVDEETLVAFYEARDPGRGRLRAALRQLVEADLAPAARAARLHRGDAAHRAGRRRRPRPPTPTTSTRGGLTLPLSYAFEPGHRDRRRDRRRAGGRAAPGRPDAVHLAGARAARGAGHRADQDAAQARCAGTSPRPPTTPAPCSPGSPAGDEPLLDGLERELGRMRGVHIPREAWELDRLPEHLTVTFRVVDEHGREVATGTDLDALRRAAGPAGARRAGRGRRGPGAHRAHHLVDRHAAPRAPDPPRRARGHRLPGAGRPRRLTSTSGSSRPRPSAIRPSGAACAGCCCWRPRRRPGRCSAGSTTRPSWRCPATRTARWPRCWTTASPPPPTRCIAAAGGPAWDERGYARLRALFAARLAVDDAAGAARGARRARGLAPGAGPLSAT